MHGGTKPETDVFTLYSEAQKADEQIKDNSYKCTLRFQQLSFVSVQPFFMK